MGNRARLTVESKAILKLNSGKAYAVLLIYGNGDIEAMKHEASRRLISVSSFCLSVCLFVCFFLSFYLSIFQFTFLSFLLS